MSLVGKFVFYMGPDYHQSGEIIEQVAPDVVLIKWDNLGKNVDDPSPDGAMILMSISSMIKSEEEDASTWDIYATREELQAFHEWLCKPSKESPSPKPNGPKLKLMN